jgi:hypothetical protein
MEIAAMKRTHFPALIALALAGCATTADLPANYALDADQPEGLAVVSLTLSGMPLNRVNSFAYRIREVPPRDERAVATKPHFSGATQHARWVGNGGGSRMVQRDLAVKGPNSREPLDIVLDGKPGGRLATVRLPAGEYEFHAWRLKERTSYGELEYAPQQGFAYRFSIKPGVATYLGRLHLHLDQGNTQRVAVEDRQAEDMNLLGQKYPALRTARLIASIGTLQP